MYTAGLLYYKINLLWCPSNQYLIIHDKGWSGNQSLFLHHIGCSGNQYLIIHDIGWSGNQYLIIHDIGWSGNQYLIIHDIGWSGKAISIHLSRNSWPAVDREQMCFIFCVCCQWTKSNKCISKNDPEFYFYSI